MDIFTGREADDFADWLRGHPGVRVICRNRASAYAAGARDGAPDAIQIADRWHLWHNLCQHVEKLVAAHHACPPEPAPPSADEGRPDRDTRPVDLSVLAQQDTALAERTRARYAQVQRLREQGLGVRRIARRLNLDRKTVRRFTAADGAEQLIASGRRTGLLDAFKPNLHERLAAGMRNATVLHTEIAARGYTGSYQTLSRYLRPLRHADAAALAALPNRPAPISVRQVTGSLTADPEHVDKENTARLAAIRDRCPELDAAAGHVANFAKMITNLDGSKLAHWMHAVDADDGPQLHSFTAGLRADLDAVTNGLICPCNSGPVEGNVNRIKMIKRQMYGRANPDPLRKRVLLA